MEDQALFYRDTWAEVDLDSVAANINGLKTLLAKGTQMIAVVKANAYGHGDAQIAETALESGASYLAVAFLDEAIALRKKGIAAPILVLGASRAQDISIAAKHEITLTVFQEEWLLEAKKYMTNDLQVKVHIKIDSGMGRIGVKTPDELQSVEQMLREDGRFLIEGVFTHFATADELDNSYYQRQLTQFNEMVHSMKEKPELIHASNSAAALRHPEAHFNAVRMGIAMYGLTPSIEIEPEIPFPLKEAFSLHSKLIHVKRLRKGEKVSYGATYEATEDEWIGTIPIGYADGWIRRLQGQEVLVEGMKVPIVGRICMDQCMLKLPFHVPVGTVVTLIGKQKGNQISINDIAARLQTINYEVPCIISNRVPRIYRKSGRMVDMKNSILSY
ncbi:alanine racemase [Bacillus massilinigeriensis]|uniref:alanine racemase n=1 Tax=Bacillus massilionigeriensis TaxID=1805475 RepID=UPI00096B620A|nr:alanine racemase [Bacillus massilionigeriensis]